MLPLLYLCKELEINMILHFLKKSVCSIIVSDNFQIIFR